MPAFFCATEYATDYATERTTESDSLMSADNRASLLSLVRPQIDATLAQLKQSKLQVVLTGRPETMVRLRSTLEMSPQVYRPKKDVWQVQLEDFTGKEASIAAPPA